MYSIKFDFRSRIEIKFRESCAASEKLAPVFQTAADDSTPAINPINPDATCVQIPRK